MCRNCSTEPVATEKRMQKRHNFAVSVDAKEPRVVEIEEDGVSEEVPMDLGEPISSEGQSGLESTPKDIVAALMGNQM